MFFQKGNGEDLRHPLMDLQGDRLREMDEFGIEFAYPILKLTCRAGGPQCYKS